MSPKSRDAIGCWVADGLRRCRNGARSSQASRKGPPSALALICASPRNGGIEIGLALNVRQQPVEISLFVLATRPRAKGIEHTWQIAVVGMGVRAEKILPDDLQQASQTVPASIDAAVGQQLGHALLGKDRRWFACLDERTGIAPQTFESSIQYGLLKLGLIGEKCPQQPARPPGDVRFIEGWRSFGHRRLKCPLSCPARTSG
jgi:hypothetical protein